MTFTESIKNLFFKICHLRRTRVPFGVLVLYVVLPPGTYHLVFVRWFRPQNELHTAGELGVQLSDVFILNMCNNPPAARWQS